MKVYTVFALCMMVSMTMAQGLKEKLFGNDQVELESFKDFNSEDIAADISCLESEEGCPPGVWRVSLEKDSNSEDIAADFSCLESEEGCPPGYWRVSLEKLQGGKILKE